MKGGAGDVAMIGKGAIGSWYACGKALRQSLASFFILISSVHRGTVSTVCSVICSTHTVI